MSHIRNIRRYAAALSCLSLGVLVVPVVLAPGSEATGRSPVAPFPGRNVDFVGFGNGSGIGMGQWGAFGYAAVDHRTYQWILAHYYGGTTLSTGANLASSDPAVSVDLNENDGDAVVVTSQAPFSFGGERFTGGQAAQAVLSQGTWTLSQAPSCSSTNWTPVASQLVNPVAVPSSVGSSATLSQVLTICEHDGVDLPVRGDRRGLCRVRWRGHPQHPPARGICRERHIRRSVLVVGTLRRRTGAPSNHTWGFQALEAQAIATRSYAAAELVTGGWAPYATTCDSSCQSYPGWLADENGVTDLRTAAVRRHRRAIPRRARAPRGSRITATATPVFAEYSASTGGYTVGGQFPGVVDPGDSVCIKSRFYSCNPCHKWWASVPVSALEKAFPSVGELARST